MKKERDKDMKRALEFKKDIKSAVQIGDKNSIAFALEPDVNSQGKEKFKYVGPDNLHPALKSIIKRLLSTDTNRHYRYCPCCKNYEKGQDPNADQMGEFLEYLRQQHYKTQKLFKKKKRLKPRD